MAAVDLRRAEHDSSDPCKAALRALAACLAATALACSDVEHTVGVHDVGLAGGSGMRATPPLQAGVGGTSPPVSGTGAVPTVDAAIPDANPECTSGIVPAVPKALGLHLLIDTNFIARGNEHWPKVVQGITEYSRRKEAEGISLGLRIIDPPPIMLSLDIQDWVMDACVATRYDDPSVPVAPLPGNIGPIANVLSSNNTLSVTTPLKAALEGALIYASSLKAAHPDEDKALVLVTDGFLDLSCATNAQDLAEIALRYRGQGVTSYMVELLVPPPEIWPLPITIPFWQQGTLIPLDPVARAGGTQAARSLDMETGTASDLADTLLEIQRHASGCAYWLPAGKAYDEVLLAVDTGFFPGPMPRLNGASECGAGGAYMEEGSPSLIRACPESCAGIFASGRPPIWVDDCALTPN